MTSPATKDLAADIAARLLEVRGIRALFPRRGPMVDRLIRGRNDAAIVHIDARLPTKLIRVRVGVDRAVPVRAVIAGAVDAIDEVVDLGEYELELEVAVVE